MTTQVFVRTLRGRFITVDVNVGDKVAQLTEKVAVCENVRAEMFYLSMGGRILDDCEVDFQGLATVHMCSRLRGGFPITVKTLTGRGISCDIVEKDLIDEIKYQIQAQEGIPPAQMRLIFAGKQLHGLSTCGHAGIGPNAVLHMVLRLRGGTGLPIIIFDLHTGDVLFDGRAHRANFHWEKHIETARAEIARCKQVPIERVIIHRSGLVNWEPAHGEVIGGSAVILPSEGTRLTVCRPTAGDELKFEYNDTMTVGSIKAFITSQTGFPVFRQVLRVGQRVLRDATLVRDCFFMTGFGENKFTLDTFPRQIRVMDRGTEFLVDMCDQEVGSLLTTIATRVGIQADSITLSISDRVLDRRRLLSEYPLDTVQVAFIGAARAVDQAVGLAGTSLADVISLEDLHLSKEHLGNGSNGIVSVAHLHRMPVAVKQLFVMKSGAYGTLTPEEEAKVQANFRRECEVLGALRSPYLTRYYGCVYDAKNRVEYLVMELLVPITHATARQNARAVCGDVATGLLYLHENGIIHHDIKLTNILMGSVQEGDAQRTVYKLSDFGEAQLLQGRPSATYTIRGTPLYLAPEVMIQGAEITAAIDTFAFGVTVVEVFSGVLPNPAAQNRYVPDGEDAQRLVVVPEVERRADDLARMPEEHAATREMVIRSLAMRPADRPTAREWAQHFNPA